MNNTGFRCPDIALTSGQGQAVTDGSFWQKVASFAKAAGREVIEAAVLLWIVLRKPSTPAWARATILGALAYFILPIDAIPDCLPVIGFTDDLAVLVSAIAAVSTQIDENDREAARAKVAQIFG